MREKEKKEMFRSVWISVATAMVACMLLAVPAMSANWVQVGGPYGTLSYDTSEPPKLVGGDYLTVSDGAGSFSTLGTMPTEVTAAGDFKVTYNLSIIWDPGWGGWSCYGTSGLGLFLGSTPSGTSGLFTGIHGDYDGTLGFCFDGAVSGDYWTVTPSDPVRDYSPGVNDKNYPFTFAVNVEKIGSTVTTTLSGSGNPPGFYTESYTVTPADVANWTGNKFATFHEKPYGRCVASDITFYTPGAVPEPSSLTVLGMGACAVMGLLKRRRR